MLHGSSNRSVPFVVPFVEVPLPGVFESMPAGPTLGAAHRSDYSDWPSNRARATPESSASRTRMAAAGNASKRPMCHRHSAPA